MSYASGYLKRSANYHHKQAQRCLTFVPREPTPPDERMLAYMQSFDNLRELKTRSLEAWQAFQLQFDTHNWQEIDVDVCRELDRLDAQDFQAEAAALRNQS